MVGALAAGGYPMTLGAICGEIRMIGYGCRSAGQPRRSTMTNITFRSGRDMIRSLSGGDSAIVTRGTDPEHLSMINIAVSHRRKGRAATGMTSLTFIGGINMVTWFSCSDATTHMTFNTSANHLGMVYGTERRKSQWEFVMAVFAFIGGGIMVSTLACR